LGDTRQCLRRKLPTVQDRCASGAIPVDARQPLDQKLASLSSAMRSDTTASASGSPADRTSWRARHETEHTGAENAAPWSDTPAIAQCGPDRRLAYCPALTCLLLVISGGFFPITDSSMLGQIAEVFPLRHLLLASYAAFSPVPSGGFPWWHVGVTAAWGALGLAVALRWFRWDTRSE
jgi:hypothetical protein